MEGPMEDFTSDQFLGGRIVVHQPKKGFRAGSDSILLAASVQIKPDGSIMDLGCGCGTILKALHYRFPKAHLYGVEKNINAFAYAQKNNCAQNTSNIYSLFQEDIAKITTSKAFKALQQKLEIVTMNPPYYAEKTHTKSYIESRAFARTYKETSASLILWFKAAAFLLKDRGLLHMIYPTQALDQVIHLAKQANFGTCTLFPLWPKKTAKAKRMILRFKKNSKGPTTLLPGLILHDSFGNPTPESELILRNGLALDLDS
jgi:tRNA1(Val) A37 N6-methylase TrmN6